MVDDAEADDDWNDSSKGRFDRKSFEETPPMKTSWTWEKKEEEARKESEGVHCSLLLLPP